MQGRMQSIVVAGFGGPQSYEFREAALPQPGPGEALVRLRVSGVNFLDVAQRRGGTPLPAPFVAGVEGVGEIVEVGSDTETFTPGQRVGWLAGGQGSFSEYVAVDAQKLVAIPDAVDDATAVSALMQGVTAHYLLSDTHAVSPGDIVVVHAAAGGLGQMLTQLAKLKGATVIGTVSTREKAELARSRGADHVFGYDDFDERTREVTESEGAHLVIDGIGAATFERSLKALRTRGTLAVIGAASGPVPPIDVNALNAGGSLFLTRPTVMHHIRTAEELRGRTDEIFARIASGELIAGPSMRLPITRIAEAFEALESRRSTGKIVLEH